jgi:hypothetical protein
VSQAEIAERLENFKRLRQDNPNLHIYVFDSLMRTPYQGWAGNIEEPAYYEQYGAAIFQYTSLLDKGETSKLSAAEKRDLQAYEKAIPQECQKDWFGRRRYAPGKGGDTVPDFSDEKISESVEAALKIAGGLQVRTPKRADLLLVNTESKGITIETHNGLPTEADFVPDLQADKGTKTFAKMVEDAVKAGYPVGVADIKYANGADNALLNLLEQKNLLFKLKAYAGWNTATNSTGFALGTGKMISVDFTIKNPWLRMFECDVLFAK